MSMLAKVIGLRAKKNFSAEAVANYIAEDRPQENAPELHSSDPTAVSDYINREGISEGGSFNLEGLDPGDAQDRAIVVAQMNHVARAGQHKTKFASNPFYHFVLSWQADEHPTQEQARAAAAHALKALGMQECQAIFAIHRDKEHHHHVHIVANRVHPDTLNLAGPPRYDYLVLDKACRELELAQGWQHDPGPHVVIDGQIRRLTRVQREKLALVGEGRVTAKALMAESKTGLPSLAAWAKAYVAYELVDCKTWEDVHSVLAMRGLKLEKLRSGLQIAALDASGEETRTKASAIDYRLSLGRLEKRMGAYRDYSPGIEPTHALTYSRHLENVMRGVEPAAGEIPGKTGKSVQRDQRRQERADARTALYERFVVEKSNSQSAIFEQRKALTQQHKAARRALSRELSARKQRRVSELVREHGKQTALALWAAERAQAMQELQAAQQIDKSALRRTTDMSWRAWLDREAAAGDPAALAALRGIRYREQRRVKKGEPGFEGEDLVLTADDAPAARGETGAKKDRGTGSIGGTVKPFDLLRYEIDRLRQIITYRDDQGRIALQDTGPRIECVQHDDDAVIRAGLALAAQKYGGEVFITGNDEFKIRAADIARKMGVRIANPELQQEHKARNGQDFDLSR